MLLLQISWFHPSNKSAKWSFVKYSTNLYIEEYNLTASILNADSSDPEPFNSSTDHPRHQLPGITVLISELYFACALTVFGEIVFPVTQTMKLRTIGNIMSTRRQCFSPSTPRTYILNEDAFSCTRESLCKKLYAKLWIWQILFHFYRYQVLSAYGWCRHSSKRSFVVNQFCNMDWYGFRSHNVNVYSWLTVDIAKWKFWSSSILNTLYALIRKFSWTGCRSSIKEGRSDSDISLRAFLVILVVVLRSWTVIWLQE